jgi:type IV pilus assembly protein PilY1
VAYLRGDRSQEASGAMRRRGSRLGDIINSGVAYSGKPVRIAGDLSYTRFYDEHSSRPGAVFVGANDGMLHAFHADTLTELFAYIPSFVVKNLRDLTLPSYAHRSFVDGTPVVAEAKVGGADGSWKTVLVSGAGAGGQGVFALDVSSPSTFTADDVMWEFTDRDDPALGHVVGQPQILRLRTSAPGGTPDYRDFAVVAGGVNNYVNDGRFSATGKPALFILDLAKRSTSAWQEGINYHRIELPTGDTHKANGIVNFTAVRGVAGDVRLLYVGDLQGRLWKLDFSTVGKANWNFTSLNPLKTGNTPEPLFVATDASGIGQPITVAPEVMNGPNRGYVVAFGTGKFLEPSDLTTPFQQQSFYAVYDNLSAKVPHREYLQPASVTTTGIDTAPFTWGVPQNPTTQGVHAGWYFNFADPNGGERQVSGLQMIGSYAVFTSVVPASNGCVAGNSHNYILELGGGNGVHIESSVGIQGEPLILKVGEDSSTDATSAGRSVRTTHYQIILQGSQPTYPAAAASTKAA